MPSAPILLWFRLDLRLADHPALAAACLRGIPVIPIYIAAPEEDGDWPPGAAARWWLHHSLASIAGDLEKIGTRLIIRRGPSLSTLRALIRHTGAKTVLWSRRYEPAAIARDLRVEASLRTDGISVETFNSALLFEPGAVVNQSGGPFQVFTPFWRHCLALNEPGPPVPAPRSLATPARWPRTEPLESLELESHSNRIPSFSATWQPGETGAQLALRHFARSAFSNYSRDRSRPDLNGTSRLSPHLHFGEIGPRQVWHTLKTSAQRQRRSAVTWHQSRFLAEIGWREFAHQLLYHFPHTTAEPLRPQFARFPWRRNPDGLRAWQQGQTGYPIVDAGMRELQATGWMHNRVRMIVASFLLKDLLIDWREGARWFWDKLVDADLANNTLGWQWTAGCGADAAPFFRIFHPVTQGQKFDPHGDYVRRWIPELAQLPTPWIHQPWKASNPVRENAGVELDGTYPAPIVQHAVAREVALEAMARVRRQP